MAIAQLWFCPRCSHVEATLASLRKHYDAAHEIEESPYVKDVSMRCTHCGHDIPPNTHHFCVDYTTSPPTLGS